MKSYIVMFIIFFIGSSIANAIEPCGAAHNAICLLAGAIGALSYNVLRTK